MIALSTLIFPLNAVADCKRIKPQTLATMVVVRSGLYRSTEDLVCLHDDLLSSLEDNDCPSTSNPFNMIREWSVKRKRDRANSLESRAESPDRRAMAAKKLREPIEARIRESRSIAAEPTEAAEVAEILEKKVSNKRNNAVREFEADEDVHSSTNLRRMRIIVSNTT